VRKTQTKNIENIQEVEAIAIIVIINIKRRKLVGGKSSKGRKAEANRNIAKIKIKMKDRRKMMGKSRNFQWSIGTESERN
jgi:hypothetical protein